MPPPPDPAAVAQLVAALDAAAPDVVVAALRRSRVDQAEVRRGLADANPWAENGARRWKVNDEQFLAGDPTRKVAELVQMPARPPGQNDPHGGPPHAVIHIYGPPAGPVDPNYDSGSPLAGMVWLETRVVPAPADAAAAFAAIDDALAG